MRTSDIENSINYWTNWAQEENNQRYDIALLKIWIQFEKFLGEMFVTYAIGQASETGFKPDLHLQFRDEEQLNAFLRENNRKYIDYLGQIQKLSKHIFVSDPFDVIFSDVTSQTVYNQVLAIRNYIAHESGDAKTKIINTCFSGDSNRFQEPNNFLLTRETTTRDTYYTYYVNAIKNISLALVSPIQ